MRRRALLVPVLLLSLVPAGASAACSSGEQYVDSLTVSLSTPPVTLPPGSRTWVRIGVSRAAVPAGGVDVVVRLQGSGPSSASYGFGRTAANGQTELEAAVPGDARGALHMTAEAFSPAVELPCHTTVVEHGLVKGGWGRVAR